MAIKYYSGINIAGNIVPSADSTYNIGAPALRFTNVYADNLYGNLTGNVTGSASLNVLKTGDTMTGNLTVGNGTAENTITVKHSDNTSVDIKGYGILMSRGSSYIRPTSDGTQTLYVGGFDANNDWGAINFKYSNSIIWVQNGTNALSLDSSRNLNIESSNLEMGGTTVIDSSRNITANTISSVGSITSSGSLNSNSGALYLTDEFGSRVFHRRNDSTITNNEILSQIDFQADDPTDGSFNTGARIKVSADGTWDTGTYPTKIQFYTDSSGTLTEAFSIDSNQDSVFAGDVSIGGTLTVDGTIDLSNANLDIGQADIVFDIDSATAGARGLVWDFDGDGNGISSYIGYIRAGGLVGEKMQFNMNAEGSVTGSNTIYQFMNGGTDVFTIGADKSINAGGTVKITSVGTAQLILRGDSDNTGDAGQVDGVIDFLHDDGGFGYRLNTENYVGKSAFNVQEHINGTLTSRLYIDLDGNVGINTVDPKQKFHVSGGTTSGDVTKVVIGATGGNAESYLYLAENFSGDNVNYGFSFVADGNSTNNLLIKRHSNSTSGSTVITVNRDNDNVSFVGDVTANHYFADTHFRSTDTAATLSTTGAGIVYLRPNGYNQTTGQFRVFSDGSAVVSGALKGPSTFYIDPSPDDTGEPGGATTDTGTVVILGDLQVTGTTTTIDSTTLNVGDKNIVLAKDATTAAAANGAGITINGANATMTYNSSDDRFEFNKAIRSSSHVLAGSNVYSGDASSFRNYGGVWKATTGLTGNGFQFISADATAMTISSVGDVVVSGDLTIGTNDFTAGTATIGGILLQDAADRGGLLEVNQKGTNSWAGIQVNYGTNHWSFMGNANNAGLYDDHNSKWAYLYSTNNQLSLYYNGTEQARTQNGYFLATNEFRSEVFRGLNTVYHVTPAGTSNLNGLTLGGTLTLGSLTNNTTATFALVNAGGGVIQHRQLGSLAFLNSVSSTLDDVTTNGNSTSNSISVGTVSASGGLQLPVTGYTNVVASYFNTIQLRTSGAGGTIQIGGNGTGWVNNNLKVGNGNLEVVGNIDGQVFRDIDNTAYYVDPANTGTSANFAGKVQATQMGVTNIVTNKVVKFNGSILDDSNITDTGSLITLGSQATVSGDVTINPSTNYALYIGRMAGQPNIKSSDAYAFMDSNGGWAGLNWYSSDNVALANGGGSVSIGNSGISQKLTVWGSVGATIYYDRDDTNYYVNPSSTSRLTTAIFDLDSRATTDTSGIFRLDGNYTDGRWAHRFRKRDLGGGVPLFIDISTTTANSYSELVRFGAYTGNGYEFQVFGDAKVDGQLHTPIFYDSDNTAYYVNPNGNSVLNTMSAFGVSVNTLAVSGNATVGGTLDVNGTVEHGGLVMTSGTNVDQIYEVGMSSFTLTADTWTDTGINSTDLATGTYVVQVFVSDHNAGGGHYSEYYSGTMSWYASNTNSSNVDEIVLHNAGHASNASHLQLRTQRHPGGGDDLMLQVKQNFSHTTALDGTSGKQMTFKFRRLI